MISEILGQKVNIKLKNTSKTGHYKYTPYSFQPSISQKLIQIATKFFDDLGLEGVELEDITFTGSLANYNWTKYSDIDLHLLVDF